MSVRGAVVAIKGDWADFAHSLALPAWATNDYPCPWCRCSRATWSEDDGLSPLSFPFALVSHAEYEAACTACEVHVLINSPCGASATGRDFGLLPPAAIRGRAM